MARETRERTETYDPYPEESGKWISALIALLGLWLLIETLAFGRTPANF
jgi:hypothetical protein